MGSLQENAGIVKLKKNMALDGSLSQAFTGNSRQNPVGKSGLDDVWKEVMSMCWTQTKTFSPR